MLKKEGFGTGLQVLVVFDVTSWVLLYDEVQLCVCQVLDLVFCVPPTPLI
jgi:hypothetical protein